LSTLRTYVINLVSDDGSTTSTTTTTNGSNGKAVAKDDEVKVAVETKMGSTGIREWISRQQTREREMEGNGDKSFS
jgi:predicted secreted protein